MIYQTDPEFSGIDHMEGCCVFTATKIACDAGGVDFTASNMLAWLSAERADSDILGSDDYLQRPQHFVDAIAPGVLVYKGMVAADYVPQDGEFCQDYLFNPDSVTADNPDGYHHFVLGWRGPGDCDYDPISYGPGRGSNTASAPNTYIESKRLYVRAT